MSPDAGSSRELVLGAIRRSLGRASAVPGPIAPLPGNGPRPHFEGDPVERFAAKMLEKSATLARIATIGEVGEEVARFAASVGASRRLCVSRALAAIVWPQGLAIDQRAARREDETSVTPCYAAVAESGSIVTLSGPDTPSTLNFVPENHIVIVRASQVLGHLEDVWALWRASGLPMPRSVNIIAGPSRTADIEQTIQLGAHGPRRLHVVLLAD